MGKNPRQQVAAALRFEKISKGYFFESDMLFRLNTLGAVVGCVDLDGDGIFRRNPGARTHAAAPFCAPSPAMQHLWVMWYSTS